MHRRTKKVTRAFSLKSRRKPSLAESIPLPKPLFEFEDTLVTQLRASDVLSNCYEDYDGDITINNIGKDQSPKKQTILRHPCHHDNNLVPVWQGFYNFDRRGTGSVLLGRLMNLTSLIGPLLNPRFLNEKMTQEHFIDKTHVGFRQYGNFIEKCVDRNPLAFAIEWQKLRSVCWSQCEAWHLQALPFEINEGYLPHDLHNALYWLWCVFNQVTETDTYPPSADYEEIELLLRKLFSSIGLIWEENDDNVSSVSTSSLSSTHTNSTQEMNGVNNTKSYDVSSIRVSTIRKNSYVRIVDEDQTDTDEIAATPTETLLVTFQQFLSIIADMLGSETVLSPAFGRAVKQIYLTEVDEIVKTGWLSLKKPGTDGWKRRWAVLRGNTIEFYSDTSSDSVKYQITLNNRMHVESLPDTSSHKHRFRLVEREGDFNIAWEAEMSCSASQHSHSWMLILNLTIKIQPTGLTAKRMEIAERRLERHRRRESELNAIEKKREVRRTSIKLREVRERWNLMQAKLDERAAARDKAMETVQKMDEIYDRLQAIVKKQSLIRKANTKIRSVFPSLSSDSGVEMSKDEKMLMDSRDTKLDEQRLKLLKLEDEKKNLQEKLLELQASAVLAKDTERTLILVYGPEKQASFVPEDHERPRAQSIAVPKHVNGISRNRKTSPYRNDKNVPIISISTSALTSSPTSSNNTGSSSSFLISSSMSQSHPELRNRRSLASSRDNLNETLKNKVLSSVDSGLSNYSGERLV